MTPSPTDEQRALAEKISQLCGEGLNHPDRLAALLAESENKATLGARKALSFCLGAFETIKTHPTDFNMQGVHEAIKRIGEALK